MKTGFAVLAVALSALASSNEASLAGNVSVRQTGPANVYGLVQAGRRPSSVEVEQQGSFNLLGVMQATPGSRLSAYQRGGSNVAVVRQSGFPATLSRGAIP